MPAPVTRLDHLVVVADSLDSGERLVRESLGVSPAPGGKHAAMGTHNALVGLGDCYLEVISCDPSAVAPTHARWFGLDSLDPTASEIAKRGGSADPTASEIAKRGGSADPTAIGMARLSSWVLRSPDLDASLADAGAELGRPLSVAREGLSWRISVPESGIPPLDGLAPAVLQWDGAPPVLPDSGIRLVSLTLLSPRASALRELLGALRLAAPVAVLESDAPSLLAAFDTPIGPRFLGSSDPTAIQIAKRGGSADPTAIDITVERRIAADLFNGTWSLLDRTDRDDAEDDAMIRAARASLWHWRRVGAPTQWAIGEWQCSRVHAVLGEGTPALEHARRCLDIAESERVDDFIPASAHEAMARAFAIQGDMDAARKHRNLSYRIAVDLEEEDRAVIEHDLGTLPIP